MKLNQLSTIRPGADGTKLTSNVPESFETQEQADLRFLRQLPKLSGEAQRIVDSVVGRSP